MLLRKSVELIFFGEQPGRYDVEIVLHAGSAIVNQESIGTGAVRAVVSRRIIHHLKTISRVVESRGIKLDPAVGGKGMIFKQDAGKF